MKVICDAAVLIGLAKIDRLDLLRKLYGNIYIPWAVYEEVVVRGGKRPGVEEIDRAKWIKKIKVKDRAAVNLLVSELGQGESEVLLLAKKRDLIQSIKPLFEELIDKNFRLSQKIIQTILEKAGE